MIPCDVYDITKLIFCAVVMIYCLHRNINRLSYTGRKCRRCLAKGFDLYRELGRLKVFDGGRGESGGEFLHLSFFAGLGYTPCV